MGFKGRMLYGAPGSTAATPMTRVQDITLTKDEEKGETTERGDSTDVPVKTESVTCHGLQIEWGMLNDPSDGVLSALLEAQETGEPIALRLIDDLAGKGPDADFTISSKWDMPLKGAQMITFTATPSNDYRQPRRYV
jgi:hypothetical protein